MRGPTEIAPGIHGLGSDLINWYLVEEGDRLTAVDAGLGGFARTLDADLARLGRTRADVEAVVLTHSDGDHTGLAPALKAAGARVLIHPADRETLRKPAPKGGDASVPRLLANLWRPSTLRIFGHSLRNGGKPGRIADPETFADGEVLDVPGRPRVIHTPGHTPGHCALLFEDRGALLVSDALCNHPLLTASGPRVMPRYFNADDAQAHASLAALEHVEAAVVAFGHGDPWREGPAAAVARARAAAARA